MKVKYKRTTCEVIQEYEDMLIIKYKGKATSVLRDDVKDMTRKKKNENNKDKEHMEK